MKKSILSSTLIFLFLFSTLQSDCNEAIGLSLFRDSIKHWNDKYGRDRNDERYEPNEITAIANNMLQYQNSDGGWPKDLDWLAKIPVEEVKQLRGRSLRSSFDNRSTYPQIEYLAKAFTQTNEAKYKDAAIRGLQYIFNEQRDSGGWRGNDVDGITYNDDVMIGIMRLLQSIQTHESHFEWLDDDIRSQANRSLEKAIRVTLDCQIVVDGKKTAWCQQHSHETLQPIKARTYELPSITAQESVGIVRFLMSIDNPSTEIIEAVDSAIAWFQRSIIHGIRIETIKIDSVRYENHTTTTDRIVVRDENAPPIWARFYEIETNRPFFCNRDGKKVYQLSEVQLERRTGYGWYGNYAGSLIERDYPKWKERIMEK